MRVEHDGEGVRTGGLKGRSAGQSRLVLEPHRPSGRGLIQDGPGPFEFRVRLVTGDDRAQWWERAVAAYPPYAEAQTRTEREFPVFVATRKG